MKMIHNLSIPAVLVAVTAVTVPPDPNGSRRILRHDTILALPIQTARTHVFEDIRSVLYDLPSGKVFAYGVSLPPDEAGERSEHAWIPFSTVDWDDRARRFEMSWELEDVTEEARSGRRDVTHALMRRAPRTGEFLSGLTVRFGDRDVGTVADLFVEARSARLAFVGVMVEDQDGDDVDVYSVPWSLCRVDWITTGELGQDRPVLRVEGDPRQAPDPDSGVLDDPLYRDRVYEAFGAAAPWWDQKR